MKKAEKGATVSNLFKKLFNEFKNELDKRLFRFMVKQGLVLCAIGEEGLPENSNEEPNENELESKEENSEESEENENEEESEVVVSIEGEDSPSSEDDKVAPEWIKELRKTNRELARQNKELQAKVNATIGAEQKPIELGPKPTIDDCNYDPDEYAKKLDEWHQRKVEVDNQERSKQAESAKANEAWQTVVQKYEKSKADLKVKNFEEAEETVKETLSIVQQGVIMKGCKNPAIVVLALSKNPKKLKELASITDPIEYAFAVSDLEKKLKVENRKAPPPESTVRSNGSGGSAISGTVDSQLQRLRAEAEKTGNYSKVIEYKRQLRAKGS